MDEQKKVSPFNKVLSPIVKLPQYISYGVYWTLKNAIYGTLKVFVLFCVGIYETITVIPRKILTPLLEKRKQEKKKNKPSKIKETKKTKVKKPKKSVHRSFRLSPLAKTQQRILIQEKIIAEKEQLKQKQYLYEKRQREEFKNKINKKKNPITKGFYAVSYGLGNIFKPIINFISTPFRIISEKIQAKEDLEYQMIINKEKGISNDYLKKKKKEVLKIPEFIFYPWYFVKFSILGFLTICYSIYRVIKLNIMGLMFPFVAVYDFVGSIFNFIFSSVEKATDKTKNKAKMKVRTRESKLIGDKVKKLSPQEEARLKRKEKRDRIAAEKEAARRKKKAKVLAAKERKEEIKARKKAEELYDQRLKEYLEKDKRTQGVAKPMSASRFFKKLNDLPNNVGKYLKNKLGLSVFSSKADSRLALEREALMMSFDTEDAVKSKVKLFYVYVAKDPNGEIIKGQFEAHSKAEVHSYLLNEGYVVYSIKTNKWITFLYGKPKDNKVRIKNADLVFFLTQLSTYIKAGIPLVESLKILTKQYKQKSYKRIFNTIIYDLTMGETFSSAIGKQGVAFPRLLVNMVKASEMTGELPEVLDNMADYYEEIEKTRKQMVTAMIYPALVVVLSIIVITFIVLMVIPRFVEIYASMDADTLPFITQFIIGLSAFLQVYIIQLTVGLITVVVVFNYLYKNIVTFKRIVQWGIMHIPIFKNIVIYNEVTIFSKTFSSLLAHNVFITDSMDVLNSITENEIYRLIILDTVLNLAKGEKISESFKDHWAFPDPAYEMLVTGEKTGQLPEMMAKVSTYYQELHRNAVTRLKTFIEPALIIFLTVVVGGIVLAVIIPMFSMFTMIR